MPVGRLGEPATSLLPKDPFRPRASDLADPAVVPALLQRRGKPTGADCRRLQTFVRSCMCRLSAKSVAIWLV